MREITAYGTSDGKIFKSKAAAEKHEKKIVVKEKMDELGMTAEEISSALDSIAKENKVVKYLLSERSWENWQISHIHMINKEMLFPKKKTEILLQEYFGSINYSSERVEESGEFKNPELEIANEEDPYDVYVFEKEEIISDSKRKLYYIKKYEPEDVIVMKLKKGEELSENEIKNLLDLKTVHEEHGEDRRWSKSVLTVIEVDGECYAVEWEKGLTEMQEDMFYNQPYKVKLEKVKKEITVETVNIVRL